MTVFYRGARAVITHKVIEVPNAGPRSYPIGELSLVHIVRTGPGLRGLQHRVLGISALGSLFLTMPIVGSASMPLAGLLMVASMLYAGACLRVRAAIRYEILAVYRREIVVLFTSFDQHEFDQVCRALRRAME